MVSLSAPTPRVADNLVNRALPQAGGSDDLNLLRLVQDAFHHLSWKAVMHFSHSVRKLKDMLRYLVLFWARINLKNEEGLHPLLTLCTPEHFTLKTHQPF